MFTAHSVPTRAAGAAKYAAQLEEASRLVASELGHARWRLVYQSRSGPPHIPWLEPDVLDTEGRRLLKNAQGHRWGGDHRHAVGDLGQRGQVGVALHALDRPSPWIDREDRPPCLLVAAQALVPVLVPVSGGPHHSVWRTGKKGVDPLGGVHRTEGSS